MADNNLVNQHRFDMTGELYEMTRGNQRGLYAAAARVYAERYPDRNHPPPKAFMRLHTNMLAYGRFDTSRPHHKKCRKTCTPAIFWKLLKRTHTPALAPWRKRSAYRNTQVLNVLHRNGYHPYKVHLHQDLTAEDFERRLEYATWALQQRPGFFSEKLCFPMKAHFQVGAS